MKIEILKGKKIPQALSELPANWPGLTSLFGLIGLTGLQVTLKGLVGFFSLLYFFIYFFEYEIIVSRNGLSLGYSERYTSSVSRTGKLLQNKKCQKKLA